MMRTDPGDEVIDLEQDHDALAGGWVAIAAVAVAYLLAQLIAVGIHRPPSWDESIYLSQVMRGSRALPFAPSRARGIVALISPVAVLSANIALIRFATALATAAGLFVAFWVWARLIGSAAAAIAAALFGFTWISLMYGSSVMPNLVAALAGVAATGYVAVSASDRCRPGDRVKAAASIAVMGLVRPPDAALLALIAAVYVLVTLRRTSRGSLIAIVGGLAVGVLPWLVEMSVRFGGPIAAIRAATDVSHVSAIGIPARLTQYLALADGPTLGPVKDTSVSTAAVLWLVLIGALVLLGLLQRASGGVWLPAVAGSALLCGYLLLVSGLAPRFLLPGLAQLSIVAGTGLAGFVGSRTSWTRTAAVAASVLLGLAFFGWNVAVAHRVSSDAAISEAVPQQVGLELRTAARSSDCSVMSTDSYPEIGLASGCAAMDASSAGAVGWLVRRASDGDNVFLITRGSSEQLPPGWGLRLIYGIPGWDLFEIEHH